MIIIIGASKGLGKALSEVFRDSRLLLVSRTIIKLENKNHQHLAEDINSIDFSKLEVLLRSEKIEAVFFTAGLIYEKDSFKLNNVEKEKIVNTNFLSIIKLNEYFLNSGKLEENCLICFCSSVTTFLPRHKQVLYCASKNALNSYYYSLRNFLYLNKLKIRVANLILGYIDTSMNKDIKTILPKKNPKEIAIFINNNINKLNGIYYIPFYWFILKIVLDLIPTIIKTKLINWLKI